jgi:hypothetical protein
MSGYQKKGPHGWKPAAQRKSQRSVQDNSAAMSETLLREPLMFFAPFPQEYMRRSLRFYGFDHEALYAARKQPSPPAMQTFHANPLDLLVCKAQASIHEKRANKTSIVDL